MPCVVPNRHRSHAPCCPAPCPPAAGATPDDLTERALALAFASHPALAADVVAEARQIRQSRQAAGVGTAAAAEAAAAGEEEEEAEEEGQGEGAGGEEEAAAAAPAAAVGGQALRAPYRLQRHRQSSLPIDQPASGQRSHTPLAQLLEVVRGGSGSGSGSGSSAAEEEERGLQARQLLLLDLHGSSVAAARMVLLRRLETLVLQVPQLEAEVSRMAEEWRRQRQQQREWRAQQRQRQAERQALQQQQKDVASELLAALGNEGDSRRIRSSSSGRNGGSSSGGSSSGGRRRQRGREHASQAAAEQSLPEQAAPEQAAAEVQRAAGRWPELGETWEEPAGPVGSTQLSSAAAAGTQPEAAGDGRPPSPPAGPGRQERFLPPGFCIITGVGRHSRGSGVLKAAVLELLQQQGLPTVEDTSNDGVVIVPWEPLVKYLQQQRQAMHTDHFLSAARARYLYVAAGVAGILAAANLLPRLTPWMA
ncbi:hypothetical protein ABPG75_011025 [Micractinium tetrahymenae]